MAGLSGSRVGRVGPSDRRPDRREKPTLLLQWQGNHWGEFNSLLNTTIDLKGEIMPQ